MVNRTPFASVDANIINTGGPNRRKTPRRGTRMASETPDPSDSTHGQESPSSNTQEPHSSEQQGNESQNETSSPEVDASQGQEEQPQGTEHPSSAGTPNPQPGSATTMPPLPSTKDKLTWEQMEWALNVLLDHGFGPKIKSLVEAYEITRSSKTTAKHRMRGFAIQSSFYGDDELVKWLLSVVREQATFANEVVKANEKVEKLNKKIKSLEDENIRLKDTIACCSRLDAPECFNVLVKGADVLANARHGDKVSEEAYNVLKVFRADFQKLVEEATSSLSQNIEVASERQREESQPPCQKCKESKADKKRQERFLEESVKIRNKIMSVNGSWCDLDIARNVDRFGKHLIGLVKCTQHLQLSIVKDIELFSDEMDPANPPIHTESSASVPVPHPAEEVEPNPTADRSEEDELLQEVSDPRSSSGAGMEVDYVPFDEQRSATLGSQSSCPAREGSEDEANSEEADYEPGSELQVPNTNSCQSSFDAGFEVDYEPFDEQQSPTPGSHSSSPAREGSEDDGEPSNESLQAISEAEDGCRRFSMEPNCQQSSPVHNESEISASNDAQEATTSPQLSHPAQEEADDVAKANSPELTNILLPSSPAHEAVRDEPRSELQEDFASFRSSSPFQDEAEPTPEAQVQGAMPPGYHIDFGNLHGNNHKFYYGPWAGAGRSKPWMKFKQQTATSRKKSKGRAPARKR